MGIHPPSAEPEAETWSWRLHRQACVMRATYCRAASSG